MTPSCHPFPPSGTPQQRPRNSAASHDWWRSAVVYQVYIRSFADGNGDGIGDIAGLQARLPYFVELGVDALWLNPWYPSPMADGGYDVSDYRAIDPVFGTLEEAESMMKDAHERGLKVFLDIVPNHTSDQHHWFREALAAGPGSTARDRYVFRAGRGSGGSLPPNNWRSGFGGPAWVRVAEPDGTLGQWYLHLFAPEQPDLNWDNAEVRREFEAVLRFWFDLGVDGIRIDVAHGLVKEEGLPDLGHSDIERIGMAADGGHPHWDREGVHAIFRGWRAVANSYDNPRVFVAEAWMGAPDRLARYVRPEELHTAFNFDYLTAPWRADHLREAIDTNLVAFGTVGAPGTWVLSNHDVARHVSRYGRPQPDEPVGALSDFLKDKPFDLELGTRRARAAALLTLALPGGAYIYQGEELGLWEIEDLPEELLQDPTWLRSGGTDRGRDGCRVPMPWSGDSPPFGYSPPAATAEPWLPQPTAWKSLTVQAQHGDEKSMLELYRKALHLRRAHPALGDGTMTWDPTAQEEVLSFTREPGFRCVVNLSEHQIVLPDHTEVILSSAPVHDGCLQSDTAVWLTR
jgi:alpha-glucosidase